MKNKTQAINAIKKDCQLQAEYYNKGKTCAIGCLALLSGVSKAELKKFNNSRICNETLADVAAKIIKRFGLSIGTLERIQDINDDDIDIAERRARIVELLQAK